MKKKTKKILIFSIISILLIFSMLIILTNSASNQACELNNEYNNMTYPVDLVFVDIGCKEYTENWINWGNPFWFLK